MTTVRCLLASCCVGVLGLVGSCGPLSSACGADAGPAGSDVPAASDNSSPGTDSGGQDAPDASPAAPADASAGQLPTLPTFPKEPAPAAKDHLEFGPEMDDVLQRYRDEAEANAKFASKAERGVPHGDERQLLVPVPKENVLRLGQEALDRFYRYRLRDVEAYLAHTQETGAARSAGEAFLRAYVEQATQRPNAPDAVQMLELAQQATDAGCTDPLVRTYQTYLRSDHTIPPDVVEAELLSTVDQLGPYPAVVHALVRAKLCQLARILGRSDPERVSQVSAAFVDWLTAEAADPQWRSCVLSRYNFAMAELTPAERETVLAACLRAGTADPWLMHYALGDYHRNLGWYYRGTAYAREVTAEGWRRVGENLPLAALHFRHAWALDPTMPDAPRQMIFVSGAGYDQVTSQYHWFLRTITARFDDWDAYSTMLEMLSPRWGGSHEAQYVFGEQCLATDRFDTIVPYIAVSAVETVWSEGGNGFDPERARAIFTKYVQQRDAAQAARPDESLPVDNSWARSSMAYRMLEVNMPDQAVIELRALGQANINVRTFQKAGGLGEFHLNQQMAKWTVDSDAADEINRVVRSQYGGGTVPGDYQPVRRLIEQHAPQAEDEFSRRYFKQAERVTEQLEQRAAGDWVDLRFGEEFLGWEVYTDQWVIDTDKNSLRLWRHNGSVPQLRVRTIGDFRPPTEITLDLEVLEPYPYPRAVGLHWEGFLWTINQWDPGQPMFGIEARLEHTESGAERRDYVVLPGETMQLEYAALPSIGPHKLRLRLWKEVYEFEVDGFRWVRRLPEPMSAEKSLGIGEAWPEFGVADFDGGFQISNVLLRKVEEDPPAVQ